MSNQSSPITQITDLHFVVYKEQFLLLCNSFVPAAVILSILEGYLIFKQAQKKDRDYESQIRGKSGMSNMPDNLWIYMSNQDFREKSFGLLSERKVDNGLKYLIANGYIIRRRNPTYGWDRTWQYQIVVEKVNQDLAQIALHLASIGTNVPLEEDNCPDQLPHMPESIPSGVPSNTYYHTTTNPTIQTVITEAPRPTAVPSNPPVFPEPKLFHLPSAAMRNDPEIGQDESTYVDDPYESNGRPKWSRPETSFQQRMVGACRRKWFERGDKSRVIKIEKGMEAAATARIIQGDFKYPDPDYVETMIKWAIEKNKYGPTIPLKALLKAIEEEDHWNDWVAKRKREILKGGKYDQNIRRSEAKDARDSQGLEPAQPTRELDGLEEDLDEGEISGSVILARRNESRNSRPLRLSAQGQTGHGGG